MPEIAREIAQLDYTFGYFRDLGPQQLRLCALNSGVHFEVDGALRYLELGMGQGVSLAVHAAANEGDFWGNDYNPSHVEHAQRLAAQIGKPVRAVQDSFIDLAARTDLPQFDIIGLHGIWSWVTEQDRSAIVDVVARQLRPGGLLYVSYNCSYGWSAALPLRGLMRLFADREASALPLMDRTAASMNFAQRLASLGSSYFLAYPTVAGQLRAALGKDRSYLAHEFFGACWAPFTLPEVANQFDAADLEFVASTMMLEHEDDIVLTPDARVAYNELTDPMVKEAFKECFINPQFRCDLFVKKPYQRLSADERKAAWLSQTVMLTMPPAFIPQFVQGPRERIALDQSICAPIVTHLARDNFSPKRVDELTSLLPQRSVTEVIPQIIRLISLKAASVTQDELKADGVKSDCRNLNRLILDRAVADGRINVLASPVLGAGVNLARLRQFFVLAHLNGLDRPGDVGDFALACCEQAGEPVLHNGLAVESSDARREALVQAAVSFSESAAPILKAAGIL